MTVGEQLKQAREARGLTLEQAAQATHVRIHYLEALENDQRNALPSVVQGRGFLRLYAGWLNLSETEIVAAWDGKTAPSTQSAEKPPAEVRNQPEDNPQDAQPATGDQERVPARPVESEERPDSQVIFEEIGRLLRTQREALGLTLAEVERYTRLRQHYLQAIEDGRMEGLPSPVQGRGMFSNYATFLNMDEEDIMLRFAEGLQTRRMENLPRTQAQGMFPARKRPAKPAPLWRRFLTPDLLFGVAAAAILLFYVLWSTAQIGNTLNDSQVQEPTLPGISEILLTSDLPTASPTTALTPGVAETPQEAEQATSTLAEPGLPILETELPTEEPTATLQAMNSDPLQVYIVARQRAWLRVQADGKVAFLGRIVPGNAYAFSGKQQIELLTGNAGGVQVFFNQADLGILGQSGQVVGMIFSPEGALTPTPAFTATPQPRPATVTALPSPTPTVTPTVTPFIPES